METKQVIVFRKDLLKGEHAIRKGKLAGQVAHASLGAFLKVFTVKRFEYKRMGYLGDMEPGQFFTRYSTEFGDGSMLDSWLNGDEHKMIPYALITDSGKTEFGGVPTVTCLGIGPYMSDELDKLTGNLPLL